LDQLIPSQIRALRLNEKWTQSRLGEESDMKQSRISASENPGEVNFSLETLIRIASAFRVGLQVRFVPYSEMLDWENRFSQDDFSVVALEDDKKFIDPGAKMSAHAQGLASGTHGHWAADADAMDIPYKNPLTKMATRYVGNSAERNRASA
jgi:transcriptional regulator with XRE-family HTH domain